MTNTTKKINGDLLKAVEHSSLSQLLICLILFLTFWFILCPFLLIPSFLSSLRSGVRGLYTHTVFWRLHPSSGHPAAVCVWGGAAQVQTHPAETHCKVMLPPLQTPLQTGVDKLLHITSIFLLQATSISVQFRAASLYGYKSGSLSWIF